jgi:hypothetical protein
MRRYAEGFGGGERIGLGRSKCQMDNDRLFGKEQKVSMGNLVVICYCSKIVEALEEVIATE